MDNDGQRTLSFEEFRDGVRQYGVMMDNKQLRELFDSIDTDCSGELDYEEFLMALRVCSYHVVNTFCASSYLYFQLVCRQYLT
jgi:Ca2+-binding EF-hand superfamily protein